MAGFSQLAESLDSLWFFNNVLLISPSENNPSDENEIDHEGSDNPNLSSPVIEQSAAAEEEEEEEEENDVAEEEEGGGSAELVFDSKPEPVLERRKRMMRRLKSKRKVVLGEIEICLENVWGDGVGGGGGGGFFGRSLASQRVKVASPVKDCSVIRRNYNHAVSCSVK
ncbi:hypothetical protein LINGRAPRIM_LOCUS1438 [Linum grandiflorum]